MLCVRKRTIRAITPCCLDRGMVMLVAYDESVARVTNGLKAVLQSLDRGPGRADIDAQSLDITVRARHLAHETAGDALEIASPLIDYLCARRDDNHPLYFPTLNKLPRDRASGYRLTGAGSRIDHKVTVPAFVQ